MGLLAALAEEFCAKMSEHYLQPVYEYLTRTLLRLTDLQPEDVDAVDLGGGNGLWLSHMLECGFKRGTLVDADPEKIRITSAMLSGKFSSERWQTIQADVAHIPVADGAFNLVVSRSSMHLWPNLSAAWHEISRITRMGGYVFSGRGYGPDLPEDLRCAVKAEKYKEYGGSNEGHHEPPSLSGEELSELAARNGFSTLAVIPDHKAYWFLAVKNS